jgi:ubiquitin C-terminal hydrolase
MNSVLQVLAHSDDFKNYFLENNFSVKESLSFALKKFLREYFDNKKGSYFAPKDLHEAIRQHYKNENSSFQFANGSQFDAPEFLGHFLSSLEIENREFVNIFRWQGGDSYCCQACNHRWQTKEDFLAWPIAIKSEALVKKELSNNKTGCRYEPALITLLDYYTSELNSTCICKQCRVQNVKTTSSIPFFPKYLILLFVIGDNIPFFIRIPKELNLAPYCTTQQNVNFDYTLYGIVQRVGRNIYSGHYIAAIKDGDAWYICDDRSVYKLSNPYLDDCKTCSRDLAPPGTLLLFYKKKEENENPFPIVTNSMLSNLKGSKNENEGICPCCNCCKEDEKE